MNKIHKTVIIERSNDEKDFVIKENISLSPYVYINNSKNGSIHIGENFKAGNGVNIMTYGGSIKIGDNCTINNYSVIYGHGGLEIGKDVIIATHCTIIPANHNFNNINKPIRLQGNNYKGIKINDDVWIGSNCVILDGVEIGKGAIIGAGSIVNKDIPEYSIAVGNPARIIKYRIVK